LSAAAPVAAVVVATLASCALLREVGRVRAARRLVARLAPMERSALVRCPRVMVPFLARALPERDADQVARTGLAGLGLAGVAGGALGGLGAAVASMVLVSVSAAAVLWIGRDRRERLADAALPLWIDASARAVRSGASFGQSLILGSSAVRTTPLASDADRFCRSARAGDLASAVASLTATVETPARSLVGRALAVAHRAGGPAGPLLDAVAATLRERTALQHEIRALATQARMSAVVIAAAPLAFGVLTTTSDPRVAGFVFGSPLGWACLVGGAILDGAGVVWMARLVRGAR
jgi:tight adherence protein B